MDKLKQNIALVVGLAIPVFMMLVIAGVIYFPRWFNPITPPQYDFIYSAGDGVVYTSYGNAPYAYPAKGVWTKYTYRITEGKLVKQENAPVPPEYASMPVIDVSPNFYVYHIAEHKSTSISFEEASQLNLEGSAKSPDGFEIVRGGSSGGGFPFGYNGANDYNKKYIRKDYYAEPLDLNLPQDYYGDFFVAWVMK